ncbi:MAG: HIT domain-containing protein [Thermaerobacter sp.]|nr:HIT domain-containing protein [Thermaerobacter sp.]
MTFEELKNFVESEMRMSHIYQPLMIRALVEAGGVATVRQLALAFVGRDESQILHYERRIREMPLRVLKNHGVVQEDGKLVSLSTERLTFEQRSVVLMACEQRMQEFVAKRGLALWDYRMLDTEPIPDSLRLRVLMASGRRCALCGATSRERPLDVDHIIPRSRGGKTVLSNLQVLCSKCNRSKGNKDTTDFRVDPLTPSDPDCTFCDGELRDRAVYHNGRVFAVRDNYPVSDGHTIIITHRHVPDLLQMTGTETAEAYDLIRVISNELRGEDSSITGFNVGANCGVDAGQTVMHAHIHLVPRRSGDTPSPRGGVRGVIPDRMAY